MSFLDNTKDFIEKWNVAGEYVDVINNLPPTYNAFTDPISGQEMFPQYFPDPVTEQGTQYAFDRLSDVEKNGMKFVISNFFIYVLIYGLLILDNESQISVFALGSYKSNIDIAYQPMSVIRLNRPLL